jgi:hypothetical protein
MKKLLFADIVLLVFSCKNGGMSEKTVPEKYRVIYHGNGHTSGEVPVDPKEYEAGEMVYLAFDKSGISDESDYVKLEQEGYVIFDLEKEGYHFGWWDVHASNGDSIIMGSPSIILMPESNVEANAYWKED